MATPFPDEGIKAGSHLTDGLALTDGLDLTDGQAGGKKQTQRAKLGTGS